MYLLYITFHWYIVMVRADGNSNESRTCHLTRYEFCVVLFSRARITRLLGLKFGIPKAQHIWCFWVVIHVAVEYCWTMLNPYPRISNKWNNYTFKCQVFFLHYMQVSLATASVHSIQSHRWCVLFMIPGGLLASSFADAYTDDAGVRWPTFGILEKHRRWNHNAARCFWLQIWDVF